MAHSSPLEALKTAIKRANQNESPSEIQELLNANLSHRHFIFHAPSILIIQDLLEITPMPSDKLLRWYGVFLDDYEYTRNQSWLMLISPILTFVLLTIPTIVLGAYLEGLVAVFWVIPMAIGYLHWRFQKNWQKKMVVKMRESYLAAQK